MKAVNSPESPAVADGPRWHGYWTTENVAVVYLDLRPRDDERNAMAWLDREERSRLEKFRIPGAGRRFTLCRAALRAILSSQLGCPNRCLSFDTSSLGKPFALVEGERVSLRFNVSHSGHSGVVALSWDREVGVDIEERAQRRDLQGLIETVMGPEEKATLSSLKENERLHLFYRLWTLKEALAKARGTGLHTDFSGFQVPSGMLLGEAVSEFTFPDAPSEPWVVIDMGNEDFAAALAYSKTAELAVSA